MDYKKILNKFMKQFKKEVFINSLLKSIIIIFSISFILLLLNLFFNFSNSITIILISILLFLILTSIFYLINLPNDYKLSKRIDTLGLKDRILTMNELKDDNSFIALKQREDACSFLQKIEASNIVNISKKHIKISSLILSFYLILSTISIIGISHHFNNEEVYNPYVEVYYSADNGGVVLGDTSQYIHIGEEATEVFAVANTGYVFDKWSDGSYDPYRKDENILSKQVIVAYFIKIDDSIDVPTDNDILDLDEYSNTNDGTGGNGASGEYDDAADNVIDGNINYKDLYEQYYNESLEIINSGGTVPEYLKDLIDYYYKIIG